MFYDRFLVFGNCEKWNRAAVRCGDYMREIQRLKNKRNTAKSIFIFIVLKFIEMVNLYREKLSVFFPCIDYKIYLWW